jgi:hypothetical protein
LAAIVVNLVPFIAGHIKFNDTKDRLAQVFHQERFEGKRRELATSLFLLRLEL